MFEFESFNDYYFVILFSLIISCFIVLFGMAFYNIISDHINNIQPTKQQEQQEEQFLYTIF